MRKPLKKHHQLGLGETIDSIPEQGTIDEHRRQQLIKRNFIRTMDKAKRNEEYYKEELRKIQDEIARDKARINGQ